MRHLGFSPRLKAGPALIRLIWSAAAVVSVVAGAIAVRILLSTDWGVDGGYNLGAAQVFAEGGDIYADGRFLYPPFAAVVLRPLTAFEPSVALAFMALIEVGLVAALAAGSTRGLAVPFRALAAAAAIAFLPVVHDIVLGNTNVLIAASIAAAVSGRDRLARGVVLGIALAAVPKPWVLPLLVWMLIRRPRAGGSAIVVAAGLTVTTAAVVGIDVYIAWIDNLVGAGGFAGRSFNVGLTTLSPVVALAVGVAAAIAALACAVRDRDMGLAASAGAGVLASPYLGLYGGVPLLLAVSPLACRAPYASGLVALVSVVAVAFALPAVAIGVVVMALLLCRRPARVGAGT